MTSLGTDSSLAQSIMNEDVYSVASQNSITQKTPNHANIIINNKYGSLLIRAKKIELRQLIDQSNIGIIVFCRKKVYLYDMKIAFCLPS